MDTMMDEQLCKTKEPTECNTNRHALGETALVSLRMLTPRFWGVELSNSLVPTPASPQNRLLQLQKILRTVGGLNQSTSDWAHNKTVDEMIKVAHANQKRLIPRKSLGADYEGQPCYIDAYSEQVIKKSVYCELQREDDPVIEIVTSVEEWQKARNSNVENRYHILGLESIDLFLFSVRGEEVKSIISDVVGKIL